MWTLVNASYGIAMGQRPGTDAEIGHRQRRVIADPSRRVVRRAHAHQDRSLFAQTVQILTRFAREWAISLSRADVG
jgi:hypothetical protein